ncbi:prolyl oligopeptidase family serine peptidase [Nonomuraea ferruginea]
MKGYTPYENVDGRTYPPILAITSLNDTRVLYHELSQVDRAAA